MNISIFKKIIKKTTTTTTKKKGAYAPSEREVLTIYLQIEGSQKSVRLIINTMIVLIGQSKSKPSGGNLESAYNFKDYQFFSDRIPADKEK